jgi:hypothetical protein
MIVITYSSLTVLEGPLVKKLSNFGPDNARQGAKVDRGGFFRFRLVALLRHTLLQKNSPLLLAFGMYVAKYMYTAVRRHTVQLGHTLCY